MAHALTPDIVEHFLCSIEQGCFYYFNPYKINKCTYSIDCQYTTYCIKPIIIRGIVPHAINRILPKPMPHSVRVGMNEEDSEAAGSNGVNDSTVLYLQIFEEEQHLQ